MAAAAVGGTKSSSESQAMDLKVISGFASVTSTIAGTARQSGSVDSDTGETAKFNYPTGIALSGDGTTLFVATPTHCAVWM